MCAWQVDEAAAKLKMEITSKPQHLDEIDRKILQLEMERLSLAKVGGRAQHPCAGVCLYQRQLFISVDRHDDRIQAKSVSGCLNSCRHCYLCPDCWQAVTA